MKRFQKFFLRHNKMIQIFSNSWTNFLLRGSKWLHQQRLASTTVLFTPRKSCPKTCETVPAIKVAKQFLLALFNWCAMHPIQDSSGTSSLKMKIGLQLDPWRLSVANILKPSINCSKFVSYFSTRALWRHSRMFLRFGYPALLRAKELNCGFRTARR